MNDETLNSLDNVLQKLKSDAVTVGLTIAALMIVISVILIMFDTDTSVVAHTKRWENLRKVFICAALIAAAGALVSFGELLGGAIHA
jgi:hypothetical protein